MSLTHEEMFYLATGLVDLDSWTGAQDVDSSRPNQRHAGRRKNRRCGLSDATSATSATDRTDPMTRATRTSASLLRPRCSSSPAASTSELWCPSVSCSWLSSDASSSSSSRCCDSLAKATWASRTAVETPVDRRHQPASRRTHWRTLALATIVLVFSLSVTVAEGCSSRSTPKPRPPPPPPIPSPAVRPNITFQTYACPTLFETAYCLNNATCFIIKVGESIEYNCLCPDGYQGARCDFKSLDGTYMPHKEKMILERASIAGGATMAVVLVVILSVIFYTYVRQRRKEQRLSNVVEVSVDKLERRSASGSLCGTRGASVAAGCRCGVAVTGKSCILLRQLAAPVPPATASAAGNQGNQAKLAQVDGLKAHRIACADLAVDLTTVMTRHHQNLHPETSSGRTVHVVLPVVADVSSLYREMRAASLHREHHTAVTLMDARPNGSQKLSLL